MENEQLEIFLKKLAAYIDNKELIKLLLNSRRDRSSSLQSIIVTIISLKKGFRLNFVYRHSTKDITKNYAFAEGIEHISKAIAEDFYNAEAFTVNEDLRLITNADGKAKLTSKKPTLIPTASFSHDKIKERYINTEGNVYLRELGITNANWEVRREMYDKYRQINRYIELLESELEEVKLPEEYHVTDMGAGKGYLTFALYDYLANKSGKPPKMTGVEAREELVKSGNSIAEKANFTELKFVKGTIEKAEIDKMDILIALHACDTATDEAIYRGIKSGASLIVLSPCCHKQIRKEIKVTNELNNIVRFGILKERQAEIITDSLRAMIMEAFGYKTKVIEFISTEHTSKNIMIIGRKVMNVTHAKDEILKEIDAVKKMYGIKKHHLETLMGI